MNDAVFTERDGPIVKVVMNRPERLNAFDGDTWDLFARCMHDIDADESVRCVLITGVDEKAFSAGSDISAWSEHRSSPDDVRQYSKQIADCLDATFSCRHPVIAAINGACIGGGLLIACASDIRICGRSARFGAPINKLGMTMSYAELQTLSRIVTPAAALEILLEGNVLDADRAATLGIVNRAVADDALQAEALATAQRISERAPLVNRLHKRFVHRLLDPAPLTPEEIEEGNAAFQTEDYRTGYRAFLEKKKPEFKGR